MFLKSVFFMFWLGFFIKMILIGDTTILVLLACSLILISSGLKYLLKMKEKKELSVDTVYIKNTK